MIAFKLFSLNLNYIVLMRKILSTTSQKVKYRKSYRNTFHENYRKMKWAVWCLQKIGWAVWCIIIQHLCAYLTFVWTHQPHAFIIHACAQNLCLHWKLALASYLLSMFLLLGIMLLTFKKIKQFNYNFSMGTK